MNVKETKIWNLWKIWIVKFVSGDYLPNFERFILSLVYVSVKLLHQIYSIVLSLFYCVLKPKSKFLSRIIDLFESKLYIQPLMFFELLKILAKTNFMAIVHSAKRILVQPNCSSIQYCDSNIVLFSIFTYIVIVLPT